MGGGVAGKGGWARRMDTDLSSPGMRRPPGSPGKQEVPDQPDRARRQLLPCVALWGLSPECVSPANAPGHDSSQV